MLVEFLSKSWENSQWNQVWRISSSLNFSSKIYDFKSAGATNYASSQAILTAAQPFYQSAVVHQSDLQPDRPIGYGAFGVVWFLFFILIVWYW